MDDPWGSPWADELNNDDGLATRRTDDVADATGFGKASETLRNSINTTWGTLDDGFGGWEEDTRQKKGAQDGLDLDGAAEQWTIPERGGELGMVNDDVGASLPDWNDLSASSAREVPELSPSLLAKYVSIAREPSPDPWANTVPSEQPASVESQVDLQATNSSKESTEWVIEEATEKNSLEAFEVAVPEFEFPIETIIGPEESPLGQTITEITDGKCETREEAIGLDHKGGFESDLSAKGLEQEHHQPDETVLLSTREPEEGSSPLSSSPSETSNHDESLLDSPRTSLDEEPKRVRTTRAISPSVQEPLGHSDGLTEPENEAVMEDCKVKVEDAGLTKSDDEFALKTKHESPKDDMGEEEPNNEEPDDEFGDFEDCEEGVSDAGEELVESHDSMKPPTSSELSTPQNESSEIQLPKKLSGPVDFSINLAALETLFGDIEEKSEEAVEKVLLPDTIIADTFASAEERKMWYRVSRYGTMRKHNTGDDENYVRISWAQSQIKQDSQKIVVRWMEEGRDNGHVGLGGTGKDGSHFGWNDPNAPPVPLAMVLGSKRKSLKLEAKISAKKPVEILRERPKEELARDRSRSNSPSSSKLREHSSTNSMESNFSPLSPVAQFGWASTPTVQTASASDSPTSNASSFTQPPTLQMNSNLGHSRQSSSSLHCPSPISPIEPPPTFIQAVPKPRPISMPPPSANSSNSLSIANLAVVAKGLNDGDDDDDEWGEMVSSPVVTEAPKLPNPVLLHKKSMSLGNPFTNSIPLPNPQIKKLQFGFGHKSTSSVGNTLGKSKSLQISQPPLSPRTTTPSPISSNSWFGDLWSTPAIIPVPMRSAAIPPLSPALSITHASSKSVSSLPSHTMVTDIWSQPSLSNPHILTPPPTSACAYFPNPSMPPVSTGNKDPWASVDFSFFDVPSPTPVHPPTSLPRKTTIPRPQSFPAPPKPKSVTFSTPSPQPTPKPPAHFHTHTSRGSKSKFEMEQDEIVKKIVGGLPDLGYMLRR
ncbi:hypothetical protein DSL72_005589 [Monilinia vaccinii-corymbosi]|uniref:Uncharacterized protein n=1 Tax=Monilinia vaccinii-corymbosi TaxID=61207 RepID=A0A8A3PG22_9HELO|nr:hypothetical protein DSL72_005589 [Monilinia vaccinii-corymbosi]